MRLAALSVVCVYLSICLSVCIYLSVCLSVTRFVCLFPDFGWSQMFMKRPVRVFDFNLDPHKNHTSHMVRTYVCMFVLLVSLRSENCVRTSVCCTCHDFPAYLPFKLKGMRKETPTQFPVAVLTCCVSFAPPPQQLDMPPYPLLSLWGWGGGPDFAPP